MLRLGLFALAVTPTLAVAQTLTSTSAPATNVATPVVRAESHAASAVRAITTPVLDGRVDENICAQGQKIDQFLEIAPYVVAKSVTNEAQDVSGRTTYSHPTLGSYGADIKYGLSSNLTLDATLNPDLGQVEADPATLNLTAFETFREERRPFFLEGAGIFSFRVFCDDIDTGRRGLFYSRRIGRAPTLGGNTGDPSSTTISMGRTRSDNV